MEGPEESKNGLDLGPKESRKPKTYISDEGFNLEAGIITTRVGHEFRRSGSGGLGGP